MSDYTPGTDFSSKDSLSTGDPQKLIKGSDVDAEFDAISTAVNSKIDDAGDASSATVTATGASVARALEEIAEDGGISVEFFGSFGPSVAAATNAVTIQAAIDALTGTGHTLLLPPGTSEVSDDDADGIGFILKSGVVVRGVGKDVTILKQPDSENMTHMVRPAASATDFGLENLTLDGNRANNTSANTGAYAGRDSTQRFSFRNLMLKGFRGRTLQTNAESGATRAKYCVIEAVDVDDAGDKALQVRETDFVTVRPGNINVDALVGNNSASAVEVSASSYVSIHAPTAEQIQSDRGPGYRIVNDSRFVTVNGGIVKAGRQAVIIIDSRHVRVSGVIADTPGADGILIQNTDGDSNGFICTDVRVEGNIIRNPNGLGAGAKISNNGTELSNIVIANNSLIDDGAGTMTDGIEISDGVGGQTLDAREYGNLIVGQSGSFVKNVNEISAAPSHRAESFWSGRVTIADDGFTTLDAPFNVNGVTGIFEIITITVADWVLAISYRAETTVSRTELYNGNSARVDTTTGALTGTTGADGNLTVSPHSDGKIYIENRAGAERSFFYTFRTTN